MNFKISALAAWLPGTQFNAPGIKVFADETPSAKHLPLPIKRRLSTISKAALLCASALADAETLGKIPLVFASKWGEWTREIELLRTWAETHEVSQGNFSLSVHNTPASLFSLTFANRETYTAIAGGDDSAESALTEAVAQLLEHERVLVVCGDEPPPGISADEARFEAACIGILIERGNDFSLECNTAARGQISVSALAEFFSGTRGNALAGRAISLRKNA